MTNFESEMMVVWSRETGLYCRQHELNSYKQQYRSSVGLLQKYRDQDSFRCVSGADHGICIADSQYECMFV
jgi:hypothetical protein